MDTGTAIGTAGSALEPDLALGADEPQEGAPVRLLPVATGPERHGEVVLWTSSPAGLVATAVVRLTAEDVAAIGGERVWASVGLPGGGTSVIEGVAVPEHGTDISLTGVRALAHESRRAAPRVPTARRAQLAGRTAARTLDLSRSGARLALAPLVADDAEPLTGTVEVTVGLSDTETVSATAEVVRVDPDSGEAAVRFLDIAADDAARIDRVVLAELSARRSRQASAQPDA